MKLRYLLSLFLLALRAHATEVTLVLDPPVEQGIIFCEIYRSAADFEGFRSPYRVQRFVLEDDEPLIVEDLPPGEIVVVIYLDENRNGRLDRNFLGIPIEPIAFSNGYRPRGPPVFFRARIEVRERELSEVTVRLRKTLGNRGRLGMGVGMIARSSPYVGEGGGVQQIIPAATYVGSRFQIFGPVAQFGIVNGPLLDLAIKGSYRIGAYDEDDSAALNGLGDRKDTLMAGVAMKLEAPYGFDVEASYLHDVLDQIGGGAAECTIERTFPIRRTRLSPYVGLTWTSAQLANHDFGVSAAKAAAGRPAYDTGSAVHPVLGISGSLEVTERILVILQTGVEFLDDDITASPIVEDEHVITGFAALTYLF